VGFINLGTKIFQNSYKTAVPVLPVTELQFEKVLEAKLVACRDFNLIDMQFCPLAFTHRACSQQD
jgi:hypothetical protein